MLNLGNIGAIKNKITQESAKISFSWTKFAHETNAKTFNGFAKNLRNLLENYTVSKVPDSVYIQNSVHRYMNDVTFSFSITNDNCAYVEFSNLQQANNTVSISLVNDKAENLLASFMTMLMKQAYENPSYLEFIKINLKNRKVSISEFVALTEETSFTYRFGKLRKQELFEAISTHNVVINLQAMKTIYSQHNFLKEFSKLFAKHDVEHLIETILLSSDKDIDIIFDTNNSTISFQSMSDPTISLTLEIEKDYKIYIKNSVIYMLSKTTKRELLENTLKIGGFVLKELSDNEAFGKILKNKPTVKLVENIIEDTKQIEEQKPEPEPIKVNTISNSDIAFQCELLELQNIRNKLMTDELTLKEKRLNIERQILIKRHGSKDADTENNYL
jgi:rRNA-processing protein FCF1